MLQFHTSIGLLTHLPGMHYLHIPAKVVTQLGGSFSKRLICTVNGSVTFQCGLVGAGHGNAYISITKKRMKELGVALGDTVSVMLEDDRSEYGMEVPEELLVLLAQDEEGKRRFDALTPSQQRYIIGYVNGVKHPDKRLGRALLLIGNLKLTKPGKESFREMMGLPKHRDG